MTKATTKAFSLPKIPLPVRENIISLIPKVLKPTFKLVPFTVQKKVLIPALHSVFKEAMEDGDFEFLQDKWLRIHITDLDINWWLSFADDSLVMASPAQMVKEDVCFSASGDDLVLIAGRKQDPDTLFFQRRLKIEGDTELGLEVKNLIDAIDIEQLPSSVHSAVEQVANWLELTQTELSAQQTQLA
ncbi:ubiquinone anaerobic biosynthesis accessory factor UbiT [Thalassotalea sp. PLHSN55]|uniref:ubiquinone anaerobic biosynthesis accessory factor UbiT n=1 Tax=Thalassotalea sp. PLHSN55 TaxID=3435888 RepID=UPI003F8686A7